MNTIRIKAKHNNTTRALTLRKDEDFVILQSRVTSVFALTAEPVLSYLDEDKESVVIGSDEELTLACKNNSLTVFVNSPAVNKTVDNENKRLERINNKIERIRAKMENADEKQQKKYQERISKLEEKKMAPTAQSVVQDKESKRVQRLTACVEQIRKKVVTAEGEKRTKLEQKLVKVQEKLNAPVDIERTIEENEFNERKKLIEEEQNQLEKVKPNKADKISRSIERIRSRIETVDNKKIQLEQKLVEQQQKLVDANTVGTNEVNCKQNKKREPMSELEKENKRLARIEKISRKLETAEGEKKIKLEQTLARVQEKLIKPVEKEEKEAIRAQKKLAKEEKQKQRQIAKLEKLEIRKRKREERRSDARQSSLVEITNQVSNAGVSARS
jgi:DNA repair exonuclease SbcCD ATPase subunit